MRKEELRLNDYLAHMQEAMQRIFAYTKDMNSADFHDDLPPLAKQISELAEQTQK